jgi:hypothetical protein
LRVGSQRSWSQDEVGVDEQVVLLEHLDAEVGDKIAVHVASTKPLLQRS